MLLPVLLATALAGSVPASDAGPRDATALWDALEVSWSRKDAEAYLALWEFADEESRRQETDFVTDLFASNEYRLVLERPAEPAPGQKTLAHAQVFSATEPRGQVEQLGFEAQERGGRFVITDRQAQGLVDGLVHLSLDRGGWNAAGLRVRLPDFELSMQQGTLFTSPAELGPTVLVFVGEGTVRLTPGPASERDQLRIYCGRTEMAERVKTAFIRIHPADLHRVLEPMRLDPDPEAAGRWKEAQDFFADQANRAFVLDAPLPRSPWWLMPGVGDALVSFRTARGTLTYTLNRGEPEDISVFNREKRIQILLYPSQGGAGSYREDAGRSADVLSHDLRVRFDPDKKFVRGEDTIVLNLREAVSSLRLRLDDALRVLSVTSPEGGSHIFFRVRGQNSLVISLGPYTGRLGEMRLHVRYAGALETGPVEDESLQSAASDQSRNPADDEILVEKVFLYSNKNAWYPRNLTDDHARYHVRLDVPAALTAITGGRLVEDRREGDRRLLEYKLDQPGKYVSVLVGRLLDLGPGAPGTPVLHGYSVRRVKNEATRDLGEARAILDYYQEIFGPCPYTPLSLVFAENVTPGGHSPPGLVFLQSRPALALRPLRDDPANFTDVPGFFLAHELAHQWWGQGVGPENYRERWLSEGAAQYAAALWVRKRSGEAAFQAVLKRLGEWALRHSEAGPLSLGYRIGHIRNDPQAYRAVVYDKGAYVFNMLRLLVGDEAFARGLTAFQKTHRYQKAGREHLQAALEEASGKTLGPYFQEWVEGVTVPELRLAYDVAPAGPAFRTTVRVKATGLPGAVPLNVTLAGEKEDRAVTLETTGGEFTFETAERPSRVEINADRSLLARVRAQD
jgi:hypothetical protein